MTTEGIIAIIGALTTALMTLIPLYFREKAKAEALQAQRDVLIDGVEGVGTGPVSQQIKRRIKRTSIALGIDEELSKAVESRTKGK